MYMFIPFKWSTVIVVLYIMSLYEKVPLLLLAGEIAWHIVKTKE